MGACFSSPASDAGGQRLGGAAPSHASHGQRLGSSASAAAPSSSAAAPSREALAAAAEARAAEASRRGAGGRAGPGKLGKQLDEERRRGGTDAAERKPDAVERVVWD
ncbi:hypothetical protein FA09DRAFT_340891 [Tilletiopsis washingtonensis]|uniref:Uncharacterized protein n=1 Tax=Tilletiopsis washingtonensis TaxID=58919 RepID=A0A316Z192_9BASI|nr:hypothetical protein FA09DRAFT_340891 [Tilletiopsis washingtonensis]PWN95557.1 hypothetical protein FA09DRAFT_340891 [Tilletiopsis washingtonensis]